MVTEFKDLRRPGASRLFRMRPWIWAPLVVFSFIGMTVLSGLALIPMDFGTTLLSSGILALLSCAALIVIYWAVSRRVERRTVYELNPRRFLPNLAIGCLIGGGLIALSVLGMWITGVYSVECVSPDWNAIARDLFLLSVAAIGEELVFRGVMLRMVEERWGTAVALVLSCLFFGFAHYTNDGATVWSSIAIAVTAVEATTFIWSRTLWMPIGAHLAWNFVQGDVFGFAVSGNDMGGTILTPAISGPELLTGGAFGAEASIITVVLATTVPVLLLVLAIRKGNYLPFRCPWKRLAKPAPVGLIVFDFDGTLGDTRGNIVLTMRQTLAELGYPERDEETIAATIGVPLEKGFEQMFPGIDADGVAQCASTYRAIFEKNRKQLVPKLFPHVKETLAALQEAGYVLTIASSRSYGSLKEFLREMGIEPYISYVLGANSVTHAKPHPEPVLKTMEEMGFTAGVTLVVGDMPVDIQMGKGAGARTCAVTYGNASREDLAAAGADLIIDDFSELLDIDLK